MAGSLFFRLSDRNVAKGQLRLVAMAVRIHLLSPDGDCSRSVAAPFFPPRCELD